MIFAVPLLAILPFSPWLASAFSLPKFLALGVLSVLAAFTWNPGKSAVPRIPGILWLLWFAWSCLSLTAAVDWRIALFGIHGTYSNGLATSCGLMALYLGLLSRADSKPQYERGLEIALALEAAWCLFQAVGYPWAWAGVGAYNKARAIGTVGSPVYLSAVVAISLPILISARRYLGVLSCLVILLATKSRGGFVGVGCGLAYLAYVKSPARWRNRLALAAVVVMGGCALLLSRGKAHSDLGRMAVWSTSIRAVAERPLLGWGPENSYFAFERLRDEAWDRAYSKEESQDHAHNSVLDAGVNLGYLGAGLFSAAWLLTLWHVKDAGTKAALLGLAAASMFNPVGLPAKVLAVSQIANCDISETAPRQAWRWIPPLLASFCLFASLRALYLERVMSLPSELLAPTRIDAAWEMRLILPSP